MRPVTEKQVVGRLNDTLMPHAEAEHIGSGPPQHLGKIEEGRQNKKGNMHQDNMKERDDQKRFGFGIQINLRTTVSRQCIVLFYLAEIIGNKKQTLCHFVLGKESCAISLYYADWMPDQVRHDRENFPLSSTVLIRYDKSKLAEPKNNQAMIKAFSLPSSCRKTNGN